MPLIKIDKETYFIKKNLLRQKSKHRNPKNWITLWFYKDRKPTMVPPSNVIVDRLISSKLQYQKGHFYKMTTMSAEDPTFDYYFKIKPSIKAKHLIKRNGRGRGMTIQDPNKKIVHWKDYKAPLTIIDDKVIVSF